MGDSKVILSKTQQKIVESDGNVVINACPGSGKTFSVAARIAHLLKTRTFKHQGIAAISFTNTAWEEIEKKLKEDFDVEIPLKYPHFLGTIDSFLNKYVFLPFGHLRLNTNERPNLVGEPHSNWSGYGHYASYFDKISIDKQGSFYISKGTKIKPEQREDIFRVKRRLMSSGYANQSDANYISMRILNCYPLIARNISLRFPHLIIDEAQDTTDVQMAIVDMLKVHTKEVLLIGDPDQAIFEWNNAKPELFHEKIKEWGEIQLFENRRSSQKICECANKFIGTKKSIPLENSDVKSYSFKPQIEEYISENKGSIEKVKSDFLELCKEHEIVDKKIAIIYRSKSMGNFLGNQIPNNNEVPWEINKFYVRDIIQGKYLLENGNPKKGFKYLEQGYHKAATGESYLKSDFITRQIAEKGFIKYRQEIYSFINLLPDCKNKSVEEWILEASLAINGKFDFEFPIKKSKGNIPIDSLFRNEQKIETNPSYHIGTIHSVKGETFDAVLMFLKEAAGNSRLYKNLLQECKNDEDSEEKRIVYVGLTRARKLLVIAVPSGNKEIWSNYLELN